MNRSRSKTLNLSYLYYPSEGVLRFEDGVSYLIEEAVLICKEKMNDESQRAVHLVKKVFDGELVTGATVCEPYRKVLSSGTVEALPPVVQRKTGRKPETVDAVQMRLEL